MNDPGEAIPAVHHLIENFQPIFSASQQRILQGSAKSTAVFSFLGSCLIIRSILKNRRSKMKKVYHRLMLAISSVDCLTSMTFLLSGPWIIPSVASFMVPGARGSFQACEASGFFLNMLMASMWYSLFMALYFLLTINFQWKEERMARLVEPAAHGVSLLVPLVLGVRGVLRDEINPFDVLPGMCWFMAFPPNCAEEGNGKEDCIRGHTTPKMLYQVMFVFIGILGSMIAILCKVRSTEVRLQRYSGGNSLDLTRQTGTRALLYIVAFLLTYSPWSPWKFSTRIDTSPTSFTLPWWLILLPRCRGSSMRLFTCANWIGAPLDRIEPRFPKLPQSDPPSPH